MIRAILTLFIFFIIPVVSAQVNILALDSLIFEDFNTLAPLGIASSLLPSGWLFVETGSSADTVYMPGTGSSGEGDTYSYGVNADRAFGGLRSGSVVPLIGAYFVNNSNALITALEISYVGKQWRLGTTARASPDRLDFQFSVDATSLSTGNWEDVDSLDFRAPLVSGTAGATTGYNATDTLHFNISGLSLLPGASFWIRWKDFDVTGADDGLSVDNFSITPRGIAGSQPSHITPIAEVRKKVVGTRVTIAGRVTAGNQFGSPSYIQDHTGGIPVYDFRLSTSLKIGDSVMITGPIDVFNKQMQISGTGITYFKADSTYSVPEPKLITVEQLASYEGQLVTVQHVKLVNKDFVFYPQTTERITDGTFQADLRIDGDTDIPGHSKPQKFIDITGVVGRFQSATQLLPRFAADIPRTTLPIIPSDSIPIATTFDLMNWNLEFFGAKRESYPSEYGPSDELLQRDNVAIVIGDIHPDLLAVQEVSDPLLLNELMSRLPGYSSVCSARYSHSFEPDDNFPPQRLCFIYDTATVKVISARPLFEKLFDDARTNSPKLLSRIPGRDPGSFWSSGRLPFLLTADVTINDASKRIHFINLHAKSGATVEDLERRAYDMQVLKDSLDAFYPEDNFVLLGDLNDDLDESIVIGQPSPYAKIVSDSSLYYPITLPLVLKNARSTIDFPNVIDHQIVSRRLKKDYIVGSVRIVTPFLRIRNFGVTTSDHLPVYSRFKFITDPVPCLPSFTVCPNPTHGPITMMTEASERNAIVNGRLIDVTGRQIADAEGTAAELSAAFSAALSDKKNGMYFLQLTECGRTVTVRVVKL